MPTGIVVAVILVALMISGCASVASKGLLAELRTRLIPELELGDELLLLQKESILSTMLINTAGMVHVFTIDEDHKLNHIEIDGDRIVRRQLLGKIDSNLTHSLDVVEHPSGQIRVPASDKQYLRLSADGDWLEIKNNRCSKFIPIADELFCAFVVNGKEVNAPARTDVTVGFIILIPVAWWKEVVASKLVLAHETPAGWSIRAVLDPDTPMDAGKDFMVEADTSGNLHVLYSTSTGSGGFAILAGPYGGSFVGGGSLTKPGLNYAVVRIDQLLSSSPSGEPREIANDELPVSWLPLKGHSLGPMPFIRMAGSSNENLRPLNRHFAVNKRTDSLDGLMWVADAALIDETGELNFFDTDHSWVIASVHNGKWLDEFTILTAKDLPVSKHQWLNWNKSLLKSDVNGTLHVLIESSQSGFWTTQHFINYFVKGEEGWSAPLTLGRSRPGCDRWLAINHAGDVFAIWVNDQDQLAGKWIRRPRGVYQH